MEVPAVWRHLLHPPGGGELFLVLGCPVAAADDGKDGPQGRKPSSRSALDMVAIEISWLQARSISRRDGEPAHWGARQVELTGGLACVGCGPVAPPGAELVPAGVL